MNRKIKLAAFVLTAAAVLGVAGLGAANAQGPVGPGGGMPGGFAFGPPLVCSTTNYTDIAAKALGIDSTALRQALVGGKTLEEIATSKQVAIKTVEDALAAAQKADLDQAAKDGLIPQDIYTQIKANTDQAPTNATPEADANQAGGPNRRPAIGFAVRFLAVPDHNIVNPLVVAAKAIGISCADLGKAVQSGQSIAQVAISKNVQVQTVIDAVLSAQKDAIAADLKEGLISKVEADAHSGDAINQAGMLVYSVQPRGFGACAMAVPGGMVPCKMFGPGQGFPDSMTPRVMPIGPDGMPGPSGFGMNSSGGMDLPGPGDTNAQGSSGPAAK